MNVDWPLVGREAELREFAATVIHDRRSLILAGAAGVGKSRLAAELRARCERAGLAAVTVTGTAAASTIPFGALAPLLPPVDRALAGRVDAKADLLHRTATTLVESAAPRRLVVIVEDAHLLDDASATLIYQLAATGVGSVVATVRTGESSPDPIVALWKDSIADRQEIVGLSSPQVGELLSVVLEAPLVPQAVAEFVNRSRGNVLFLRELVMGAVDSGTLCNDGGIWHLCRPLAVSERLSELVGARLRGLTADELALLELVAVGEPLGVKELTAMGDPDVAEQLERQKFLISLIEAGQVVVRFAHPVYSEVVRQQMPALRRRFLARALADSFEHENRQFHQEDLLRIAVWRLDGGGGSADLMLAAAAAARWRYDFALAERCVRVAQEHGAGFDADLLAAQLASLQGRGEDAEKLFAVLEDSASTDQQRGALALTRIDNLAFYLGRASEGIAVAEDAERRLQDPAQRDQIQARRSALVFSVDGPLAGARVAAPLLERADGKALVWAAQVAAFSLGRMGRIKDGVDATMRGHAAQLNVHEPMDWYPWTHLFFRCQVLSWSGEFEQAHQVATEQFQLALTEHSIEAQAWFAWHFASVVAERGNVASAVEHGRAAVALFRDLGRPQFMAFGLTYLATALALSGQAADAHDTLSKLRSLGLVDHFMGVDPVQAQAWTAVAAGDLPKARALFAESASRAKEIGDSVGRAAALHGLARLGQAREVHEALSREADRVEGALVRARAAHVRALAHHDVDGLISAGREFETMGAYLLAAEAMADAAVTLRQSMDSRQSTAVEHHARLLSQRCEGATTPSLARLTAPVLLSRAERDAALLAAAGRSNKEIATELYLSVRTVEGRLQRAYTKLGVGSRSELADALEATNRTPT